MGMFKSKKKVSGGLQRPTSPASSARVSGVAPKRVPKLAAKMGRSFGVAGGIKK